MLCWFKFNAIRWMMEANNNMLNVIKEFHIKQLTQNWFGQEESDCLIKTKHCDGFIKC
jgi:hypothetical protein